MIDLLRHGRGVSFREIEVAIEPIAEISVGQDLASFLRNASPKRLALLYTTDCDIPRNMLHKQATHVSIGFVEPSIDLILQK